MKQKAVKTIITLIIAIGVEEAVDNALDALVPMNVRLPAKIIRKIGISALSWIAADYVCDKVNGYYNDIDKALKQFSGIDEEEATTDTEMDISEKGATA